MAATTIPSGLSLPRELYERIEKERGYEPRSHYIVRMLSSTLNKTPSTKEGITI